jgi:hypothetical protein
MTMDGNDPSTWTEMVPLIVVGGCFLAGLAIMNRELSHGAKYRIDGPSSRCSSSLRWLTSR